MRAERFILETDDEGHLTESPTLPPRVRIEAFFVILDATDQVHAVDGSEEESSGAGAHPEAGRSRGLILSIADDFDAPLDDFQDYQ